MKKILFSLLLLAGFANAITCVEAVFASNRNGITKNTQSPYPDSIHVSHHDESDNQDDYDNHHTFVWKNDRIAQRISWDALNNELDTTNFFYVNSESELSKKGQEIIFSSRTSNDTIIGTTIYFEDGILSDSSIEKSLPHYYKFYMFQYDDEYFDEYTLSGDTLTYKHKAPILRQEIFINDAQDKSKCNSYNVENNYIRSNLEVIPSASGFVLKEYTQNGDDSYLKEFYMSMPGNTTTAIRKLRPTVKISPKVRYFDLLGRYKFSK